MYWNKVVKLQHPQVKSDQSEVPSLNSVMELSARGEVIFTNLKNKNEHQQKGTH